jgi:undecaprenyl-diphosphatase
MLELLYSLDKSIFHFCNQTIANPVFDVAMPFLTDLNKTWYGRGLFGVLWALLMWKGGKRGRTVGILIVVLLVISDQLSSSVIKKIFERPRPCHTIDGMPVVDNIRLLVDCGSGYSFPSSHAVNNFAVGTLLSFYYRRWTWACMTFASLIAFTRVSVGVHFPSDILGGAVIGAVCAYTVIVTWHYITKLFPGLNFEAPPSISRPT